MTATSAPPRTALLPGEELAPGYVVTALLSRGQALDVYEVWSEKHWCHCVAKTVRPERDEPRVLERLLSEGRLLSRVAHPHLVRGIETITSPRPVVVVELVLGDTLEEIVADRRRRLPAGEVAQLGLQLAAGLRALHSAGVLHLDVRPANVMARGGAAILLDLSIARPPGRVRAGYGTPGFMAPEQERGEVVGEAADVWGLGGTLFYAAVGGAPAYDRGRGASVRRARRLPADLAAVIDDCLVPAPCDRPTLAECFARLRSVAERWEG